MNEHPDSVAVRHIKRHQFTSLLIGSIIIALFFVFVALSLYQSSGTIQLDLSRPGYAEAREEATKDNEVFAGFSSNGPITAEALEEFDKLYNEQAKRAMSIDAFSGDALSDKTMRLEAAE